MGIRKQILCNGPESLVTPLMTFLLNHPHDLRYHSFLYYKQLLSILGEQPL